MKHQLVLISASILAMSGVVSLAQAGNLVHFDELCGQTIDADTTAKKGGPFIIEGDCGIQVNNATLEILGVTIVTNAADGDDGRLIVEDITDAGGIAELVIKNSKFTTDDRLLIEGAWDGGVTFKNNYVDTGDDLRVKPVGDGDLVFKNNRGQVVDDIRLGDTTDTEGLDGDMDVRNNKITLINKPIEDPLEPDLTEFVAQSFDGHIDVRNNRFGKTVGEIDIRSSGSGNVRVKNNRFLNTETVQEEIFITAKDGDVHVRNSTFGDSVDEVDINSVNGQCTSRGNSPELVDQLACHN